jgi:hypothetical protein
MTITHNFRSGNACDIHIPDKIKPGFDNVAVEWETYPPSEAEFTEYWNEVYPIQVLPVIESILLKQGPGRMVEILPGLRVWIPKGSGKEKL